MAWSPDISASACASRMCALAMSYRPPSIAAHMAEDRNAAAEAYRLARTRWEALPEFCKFSASSARAAAFCSMPSRPPWRWSLAMISAKRCWRRCTSPMPIRRVEEPGAAAAATAAIPPTRVRRFMSDSSCSEAAGAGATRPRGTNPKSVIGSPVTSSSANRVTACGHRMRPDFQARTDAPSWLPGRPRSRSTAWFTASARAFALYPCSRIHASRSRLRMAFMHAP